MAIRRRGLLWESTVDLTAAQVRAWHTTPIEGAPAAGVNRINRMVSADLYLTAGSQGFSTDGAGAVSLGFALPSGNQANITQLDPFMLLSTSSYLLVTPASSGIVTTAGDRNQPLLLTGNADLLGGGVATIAINAAGAGYGVNDTGTINAGNADAVYRVTAIGAAGAVTGAVITVAGNGYVVANGLDTAAVSGIGTGLKLNVTGITLGNGTLRVIIRYHTPQVS